MVYWVNFLLIMFRNVLVKLAGRLMIIIIMQQTNHDQNNKNKTKNLFKQSFFFAHAEKSSSFEGRIFVRSAFLTITEGTFISTSAVPHC